MKHTKPQHRAYISGKITGLPDLGLDKFNSAENYLYFRLGPEAIIVNPHKLPANHDKHWTSYMKVCLGALVRCNVIVVLPDWKQSRGAIVEVMIANILAIPMVEISDPNIYVTVSSWTKIRLGVKLFLNRF